MVSNFSTIGNYRLLKELASGAFGRVYRAEHLYLSDRIVAVKLLHAHLTSEKDREDFLREARTLARLKHTYILPIIDVGLDNGIPYMVTEFAEGGSLRNRMVSGQVMPLDDAIRILVQVSNALKVAHDQNVVHRDLKPENILFHANGNALLADFGISTSLTSMSVQAATIIGTPPYMAPEQFKGQLSKESDQYALACIAYELMTGQKPFVGPDFWSIAMKHMTEEPSSPASINPELPEHISHAILRALAKGRKDRYADVKGFIIAISSTSVPTVDPVTAAKDFDQRGDEFYDNKQYEEALAAYNYTILLNPSYVDAYNGKGNTLYKLGRYEEALGVFAEAIRLDPSFASAYNGKGYTLDTLQRYEEALAAYEEAIRLDPSFASAYSNKGNTLHELQRYEEALFTYEEAIRLDPSSVYPYQGKGDTLQKLRRYEEALAAYEEAIRLDPSTASAYNDKGDTLHELRRYEEALFAYEGALRLDPSSVYSYNAKGDTLYELRRYKEALAAYKEALRLDPSSVYSYQGKGDTLYELQRYEEALAAYEEALHLDPSSVYSYNAKGNTLQKMRRYEAAQAAFEVKERLLTILRNDPKTGS